jgi:hypothetical protein
MSHDGSTLAGTTWRHPAVSRSDHRRPPLNVVRRPGGRSCVPTDLGSGRAHGWGYPESRPSVELLIDSEEDLVPRVVLVGCCVSPTADSARCFGAERVTADHRPCPRATTIGLSANAYGPTAYRLQRRRSVPFGGRTVSPERGPSPEEVAHMNTHFFPLFRIAFGAAAAVFIFLIVHAALEGISRSADVLAGLQ